MAVTASSMPTTKAESRVGEILQWLSFILMAGLSIPHLTAFFRTFEPIATGWEDQLLWVSCVIPAITIDGFTVMVTRALLIRRRRRKSLESKGIKPKWYEVDLKLKLGLAGSILISFLVNWWYAQMQSRSATQQLGSLYTIGTTLWVPNDLFMPLVCASIPFMVFILPEIADALKDQSVLSEDQFKPVSDQEHQDRIRALQQQQDLKRLQSGPSVIDRLAEAREKALALIPKQDRDALMQMAEEFLSNKSQLRQSDQRKQAIKLLAVHLKTGRKEAELFYEQAVAVLLEKEKAAAQSPAQPAQPLPVQLTPLNGLAKLYKTLELMQSNPAVTAEEVAQALGLDRVTAALFWMGKAREMINTPTQSIAFAQSDDQEDDQNNDTGKFEARSAASQNGKTGQVIELKGVSSEVVNRVLNHYPKMGAFVLPGAKSITRSDLAQGSGCTPQKITGSVGKTLTLQPNSKGQKIKIESAIVWLNDQLNEEANAVQSRHSQSGKLAPAPSETDELIGANA